MEERVPRVAPGAMAVEDPVASEGADAVSAGIGVKEYGKRV